MITVAAFFASAVMVVCPQAIRDSQSVESVDGWSTQIIETERKLAYLQVFSGNPSKRMELKPINEHGVFVWRPDTDETWVQCRYTDSAAVLYRKVGRVESCSFLKSQPTHGLPAKAECRTK